MEVLKKIWVYVSPLAKMAGILLLGHFIIVYAAKLIHRGLEKSKLDQSLTRYLEKAIYIVLHVFVVVAALDAIGVSTSSIVAAISAAAVALVVALKDSLSNVAGGIWLLFSPRFATGDHIDVDGKEGTVISIELLHTVLQTFDKKQISIPNGVLINSHITNYSKENTRRVDIIFPIPYEADVKTAKKLAYDTITKHPLTLTEPDEPFVRVRSYGDSAVNLITRTWCKAEDYWTLYYDLIEEVRDVFEQNGISIPYNQLDVHVKTSASV